MKPAPLPQLPPPPFWRANANGRPIALTISGKGAVAILEATGLSLSKILSLLGLSKMDEQQFEALRKESSIADPDLHTKYREEQTALAEGTWRPRYLSR
jgi:hypothetical protein